MPAVRNQRTIATSADVHGVGYWSGKPVCVEFRPAPVGAGVSFVRRDLSPAARIPATVDRRVDKPRRTNLTAGGADVEMVEHVLAALAGLNVDNCEVWVDAPEMPGCDGSCRSFVAALDEAGIVEQSVPVRQVVVDTPLRLEDEGRGIEILPPQGEHLSVEFELDYGAETAIGRQSITLEITPAVFRRELATCRTFLLEQEAQWLISQGLGTHVTARDLLIFGPKGPVGNQLRFPDECVRHKVLDLIGDFALAGCPVIGHVVAVRSGHQLNAEMVQALLERATKVEPVHQQMKCA